MSNEKPTEFNEIDALTRDDIQALYNFAKKMVMSHRTTFREVDIRQEDMEAILRIFGISAKWG